MGFTSAESIDHECARIAQSFFFESTQHDNGKARQMALQYIICGALFDAFDRDLLAQRPGD